MSFNLAIPATAEDDIKSNVYHATIRRGGVQTSLGFTDEGTLQVQIGTRIINKKVDQVSSPVVKAQLRGYTGRIRMRLAATDLRFIAETILGGAMDKVGENSANGPKFSLGDLDENVTTRLACEMTIVPEENEPGDLSDSFYFSRVIPTPETVLSIVSNGSDFAGLDLEFVALPDTSMPRARRLGWMGNIGAAGDDAPLGVFLALNEAEAPYKTLTALTLTASQRASLRCYAAFGAADGVTCLLNGALGSATATSITVDNLSAGASFAVNDVLRIGTELVRVSTAYDSGTGTIGIIRGCYGTTAATALDNANVERMDVWVLDWTEQATFTSSDATKATVGDSALQTDDDKKGRLVHVAAGSTNVKARVYADDGVAYTDSPNCVTTAA